MPQDFTFQNPTKIRFGHDQLSHLPEELARFGHKVLLVYGGGSIKRTGLYDRLLALLPAPFRIFELSGVEPNPRHTTVNRGAKLCREEGIDVILAVGGGSVIDCAKGVAATALAQTDDVWDLVERKVGFTRALPIVTVLTIAATGSEMNGGSVLSNMDKNVKASISGLPLYPRVTFQDPELTYTVSPYQTASGSADIIAHIFDKIYFSPGETMDMLKRLQEEVLSTVIRYAPVAVREPENYEARANLMWAASWGLNGFLFDGSAQGAACHAMEHELSAHYDITHGHGLAILIPRWMAHLLDETTAPDFHRFGVRCLGVDPALPAMEGAKAAIDALSHFFFDALGLQSTLSQLGIDDSKLSLMADHACKGGVLKGYRDLTAADVEAIYRACL